MHKFKVTESKADTKYTKGAQKHLFTVEVSDEFYEWLCIEGRYRLEGHRNPDDLMCDAIIVLMKFLGIDPEKTPITF